MLCIKDLQGGHFGPISITLNARECVVITGPSGSGKSLFLRAVAELDPNQGEVWLNARSRMDYIPMHWRQQVGLLLAESHWWAQTVGEHFLSKGNPELAALGFDAHVLEWSVKRLSSGERQRLALLRLLSNQPRVLLLDEPTANLDSQNTQRVEILVNRYLNDENACVLWVTHDSDQIKRIADRTVIFANGQLVT